MVQQEQQGLLVHPDHLLPLPAPPACQPLAQSDVWWWKGGVGGVNKKCLVCTNEGMRRIALKPHGEKHHDLS